MPMIIGFIGWHNSGKTTLATQVVTRLKNRGYRVAVIKSTKERGIASDPPRSDTARYRQAGADSVALFAPDQLIVHHQPADADLRALARDLFPDADIVIAEGFKQASGIPKIEVRRDGNSPLLRDQVSGVVAVATGRPLADGICFSLEQHREIADFIETLCHRCRQERSERWSVIVEGTPLPLPQTVRAQIDALLEPLLARNEGEPSCGSGCAFPSRRDNHG